ncbi:MAG: cytochrome d ubiquinol oxidase subunit II [Burkholderiaceae bacterium]
METYTHTLLASVWYLVLCLLLTCYVVTDGFDLGAGIVSLGLRRESDRNLVFQSIAHVWDANETWLVVLGGVLFGAFPAAYALILSHLYGAVMVLIAAFILRGAAIEFRHVARRKGGWDFAFGFGSLLAALAQGWILGDVITGMSGGTRSVVFSSAAAIGVATGYVLLGTTYLLKKVERGLLESLRRQALISVVATVVAALVLSAGTLLLSPVGRERWADPRVLTGLICLAGLAVLACMTIVLALLSGRAQAAFRGALLLFIASLGGLALSIYPNLVPGRLTLAEAVSSDVTLAFMLVGIGVLLPVMLGYNLYQYYLFRGRVSQEQHAA